MIRCILCGIVAVLATASQVLGDAAVLRALVVDQELSGADHKFESRVVKALEYRGFNVVSTNGVDLLKRLSAGQWDVLVLPESKRFPSEASGQLAGYLQSGGTVVFFGGPPLSDMHCWRDGKWMSHADIRRARTRLPQNSEILDLSLVPRWRRDTDKASPSDSVAVDDGPRGVGQSVRVTVGDLAGWSVISSPDMNDPFGVGNTITSFWAKGDSQTKKLMVDWRERDGSRWYTIIDIGRKWKKYALAPDDFKYWPEFASTKRGGLSDRFRPENAVGFRFGLARNQVSMPSGRHVFWLAGLSVTGDPYKDARFSAPVIESLSPAYKTFRMDSANLVHVDPRDTTIFDGALKGRADVVCQVWRPRGLGCSGEREYRWIPLLYARTQAGGVGVASALTVYKNGAAAYLGFNDAGFVANNREVLAAAVANAASRLVRRPMLLSAGTDAFAQWDDMPSVKLGTTIVRLRPNHSLQVKFAIINADKKQVFSKQVAVNKSEKASVTLTINCPRLAAGLYKVECSLISDGKAIDRIKHDFRVLSGNSQEVQQPITVKSGEFMLGDKVWRGVGINYWPLYSSALEPDDFFKSWLDPSRYDPELVGRDLSLLKKLGFNSVSISYFNPEQAGSAMDFLARCDAHGIKANVYLGVHPLTDDGELAIKLIRAARLDRSPAVFAYDLGWEVHAGDESARRKWDSNWHNWTIEQYESVENASREWGYRPRMNGGVITGPADNELLNDGEWRLMVAAYRRFWDDLLCERYAKLVREVKSADNRHLLGARTGWAGCGQMAAVAGFAADLASGAIHLDFISPEYPSLETTWPACLEGGLTTAYARFAGGGKPVFWAEFGMSLLAKPVGEDPEARQTDYYRNIYRTFDISGVNATAAWWYPGGFRVDERSDWGIINPDYTPRPAALITGTKSEQVDLKETDYYIDIDRDLYVSGYAGIFAAKKAEYIEKTILNKTVALKTAGTGTDSSNVPLIAVGNVPCNGHNPPKYINAQIETARIESVSGRRVEISVLAGNTGEAKWLAPRRNVEQGAVYLSAKIGDREWKLPIPSDVPRLSKTTINGTLENIPEHSSEIELRMLAEGRISFGPKVKIRLLPGEEVRR